MIGLQQFPPTERNYLTSTRQNGPSCLETLSFSTQNTLAIQRSETVAGAMEVDIFQRRQENRIRNHPVSDTTTTTTHLSEQRSGSAVFADTPTVPLPQRESTETSSLQFDSSSLQTPSQLSQQREEIANAAAADDVVVVDTTDTTQTDAEQAETETVRRSTRVRRQPDRFAFSVPSSYIADFGVYEPVAWKASTDPDTLTWDEAMASEDRDEFVTAATVEIRTLEGNETWDEVPMSDAKERIIPGTWTFKRKRTPDGAIYRHKARYCVRGDLQETQEDTYAPVVAFSTIRLFLAFTLSLNWVSISMDWTNAFTQAKLDDPIWIHVPRGFSSKNTSFGRLCLRLKRSLYGTKSAPKHWYTHLLSVLLKIGFKQSAYDPCLLFKTGMLLVFWVDDAAVAASRMEEIDLLVAQLREHGMTLTPEASLAEFLNIKYEHQPDGSIHLTQRGLIKKILKAASMEDCHPISTPAEARALGSDPDGPAISEQWSYKSLVGMLLYLSGNTRPDISLAVSQVCRFTHQPKQSHAQAVKRILRYLKGTADMGTIVRATGTLELDNYCDADFLGLYGSEPQESIDSARSRAGYIIFLGGCPLTWKTNLIAEAVSSTLHAEYVSLSLSLRMQIVLKWMLEEIAKAVELSAQVTSTINCRAFEDNQGALLLAN